jgi:hypothetical protein
MYIHSHVTPNVVYLIDCHVCRSQYVGESVQPFNKRINGHRSDLAKKTLFPVIQQFVSPGHSLDDFGRSKFFFLKQSKLERKSKTKKERFFLDLRVTNVQRLHPEGINKKERYQKKMLRCNKNNYKSTKSLYNVIINKSTDISLDRQTSSASVI